jgi:hypothetical protein
MITTSEIKTSVVLDEKYMELAVRALHKDVRSRPGAGDELARERPGARRGSVESGATEL